MRKKNPAIKFTVLGETSKHIHFPLPFFVLLVSLNVVERISRFHCHISFSGNRQNISFPEIAIFHCHIYIYISLQYKFETIKTVKGTENFSYSPVEFYCAMAMADAGHEARKSRPC